MPSLTERETEILRHVAKGLAAKQIAARLSLSHRTVENHVQATFRKLQVANRVELARYAIELRALSHGAGSFTRSFARYEAMPESAAAKVKTGVG